MNLTFYKDLDETKAANYRNKFLGFVFQSFNLINYKTALENNTPFILSRVKRKIEKKQL